MWAPSTSASVMMMTLLVAQILVAVVRAGAAAERLDRSEICWLTRACPCRRGHVEDLAAERQHGLGRPVARLLGRAAGRVALDDEQFGARRARVVQSASLPGSRSLRVAVLRATSFSWRRRRRSSARSITQSSSLLACCGGRPANGRRRRGWRSRRCARPRRSPACPWSGPGIPARG